MITAEQYIEQVRNEKTDATPAGVIAALLAQGVIRSDHASLDEMARWKTLSDIVFVGAFGSVRMVDFRADWSCTVCGYGYTRRLDDVRQFEDLSPCSRTPNGTWSVPSLR